MIRPHRLLVVLMVVSVTVLWGCTGTPPSRFFLLTPLDSLAAGKKTGGARNTPSIGIGPVELPGYLDRHQIVTRAGSNHLNLAEFDQWAESLPDNVARVVAANVSTLLSTDHIVIFPWGRVPVKYQVHIGVTRFDADLGGDVSLVVRWGVSRLADREVLVAKTSNFIEPAGGPDYQSLVSAMSRALGKFSREVAAAFKAIAAKEQKRTRSSQRKLAPND